MISMSTSEKKIRNKQNTIFGERTHKFRPSHVFETGLYVH